MSLFTEKNIFILLLVILLIYIFYDQSKEYYCKFDKKLIELKKSLLPLHPIVKKIDICTDNNASYTINKKTIYMCLKDKQGNYYDLNVLKAVMIHELAHVITDEIGHTEKFNNNFQILLDRARKMKLIPEVVEVPEDYCGLVEPAHKV